MKRYYWDNDGMEEHAQGQYVLLKDISCENCKRRADCVYREYGITGCSKCEPEEAE